LSAAPFSAVFFEGRFVPPDEAQVPLANRGYLLGEGVFETLRGYDGVCFRTEQHLETLARGAAAFGLTLPVSNLRLVAIADEAASRAKSRDAYVRITLTRGVSDDAPAVLSVVSRPLTAPTNEDYARGVNATIVSGRRIPPACMDGTIKTTSYAAQVLARREAVSRGVGEGEGIMLAVDGSLACGTMANLFLVSGDVLHTPTLSTGCRKGVTRTAVLEVAASAGFSVHEGPLDSERLFVADEAFFTSTRVECLPISAVDGRAIGRPAEGGPLRHPRTTALRAALRALIDAETEQESASVRRGTA
jgi:branched-chain amino acid aminotransferase